MVCDDKMNWSMSPKIYGLNFRIFNYPGENSWKFVWKKSNSNHFEYFQRFLDILIRISILFSKYSSHFIYLFSDETIYFLKNTDFIIQCIFTEFQKNQ